MINVGVAPGFFSASERSAELLRAVVQYAQRRAGGSYREQGSLTLHRGRYIIVRTFGESYDVEGRTIDLFSPNLPVADDRTVPPRSLALLYDLGADDEPPHLGFVSGRVQAKVETSTTTAFFVRGPLNTLGVGPSACRRQAPQRCARHRPSGPNRQCPGRSRRRHGFCSAIPTIPTASPCASAGSSRRIAGHILPGRDLSEGISQKDSTGSVVPTAR